MILVGELSLWVALVMAAWAAAVSFAGGVMRRADVVASGARGLSAAAGFIILASAGLLTALVTHDFSLRSVASYTNTGLATRYVLSAFWGAEGGALLFASLVLSLFASIAVFSNRAQHRELMPWVTGTLAVMLLSILGVTAFGSNPFDRLDWIPLDGRGMNPRLQNPGMALHPPALYLGFLATAVPFALAVGALVTRRLKTEWLGAVRCWALTSWFFLTIGILLGMWSAYAELGWSPEWVRVPVENASLLPWLTGTALLHHILIQDERGMRRIGTVTLVLGTFAFAILGTVLLVRHGREPGVSAFAPSPASPWLAGVAIVAAVLSAVLVTRVVLAATRLDDLAAAADVASTESRERAVLRNGVLLAAVAFAVLWGTLFPVLSEAAMGSEASVGAAALGDARGAARLIDGMRDPYVLVACVLAGLLAVMIVPAFVRGVGARRRMHAEGSLQAAVWLLRRNRRRFGGYILHAGTMLAFAAFAGLAFRKEIVVTLSPGEHVAARDPSGHHWTFTSNGLSRFAMETRHVIALNLATARDGVPQPNIVSEKRQHVDSHGDPTFEPSTHVGMLDGMRQDVHVALGGISPGERAEVRISFTPLVAWVWYGGVIIAFGGLIVMWPRALAC